MEEFSLGPRLKTGKDGISLRSKVVDQQCTTILRLWT